MVRKCIFAAHHQYCLQGKVEESLFLYEDQKKKKLFSLLIRLKGQNKTGDWVSFPPRHASTFGPNGAFPHAASCRSTLRRWCMIAWSGRTAGSAALTTRWVKGSSIHSVSDDAIQSPPEQLTLKLIPLETEKKRGSDLTDIWISHVIGLALLVCSRSIEVYSPNSPEDAGSREAGSNFRVSRQGRERRIDSVLRSTWVKAYEGKFLLVVMVTGSVVCSKNISLALRLDQDPVTPRSTAPLLHFERGNADCVANV